MELLNYASLFASYAENKAFLLLLHLSPFNANSSCYVFIFISDMAQLVDATLMLLNEQSACQQIESDSDDDEDDTTHDEVLMDAVSDLLPAFSKAMGPHFAPVLAKLFNPLMKFAVGINSNV